ncbi:hypothetical protein [Nonomuraea sp. NPDC050202]|uniref:hypothetical protein n=1 Tax=Nonomuraea sp. NPDC050202 TaxID=3155035 RepID=UPI0033EC1AB1
MDSRPPLMPVARPTRCSRASAELDEHTPVSGRSSCTLRAASQSPAIAATTWSRSQEGRRRPDPAPPRLWPRLRHPHTLETLGQAADLSPSGASRAFEADEIVEVGDRTGLRPPAAKIEDYDPRDPRLGQASRTRCTWGGGDRNNPCPDAPKYTVTDKSGTRWSCCKGHLPRYLASRPSR